MNRNSEIQSNFSLFILFQGNISNSIAYDVDLQKHLWSLQNQSKCAEWIQYSCCHSDRTKCEKTHNGIEFVKRIKNSAIWVFCRKLMNHKRFLSKYLDSTTAHRCVCQTRSYSQLMISLYSPRIHGFLPTCITYPFELFYMYLQGALTQCYSSSFPYRISLSGFKFHNQIEIL